MYKNNKLKFHEILAWFFKKYRCLHSEIQNTPAYQIKDIKVINGNYELEILINGTGKITPYSPKVIASDDSFLEEFSIKDIRTILYLDFEELKKPQYTIVSHKFSEKKRKSTFCLKKRESGEIQELPATEISKNKDLLKQCSPEDAHR